MHTIIQDTIAKFKEEGYELDLCGFRDDSCEFDNALFKTPYLNQKIEMKVPSLFDGIWFSYEQKRNAWNIVGVSCSITQTLRVMLGGYRLGRLGFDSDYWGSHYGSHSDWVLLEVEDVHRKDVEAECEHQFEFQLKNVTIPHSEEQNHLDHTVFVLEIYQFILAEIKRKTPVEVPMSEVQKQQQLT